MTTCAGCCSVVREPVNCLKCMELYCSRRCQVRYRQFHKLYCEVSTSVFVHRLINQLEPQIKPYCYLQRHLNKTPGYKFGNVIIESDKPLMNPRTKNIPIQFGIVSDPDCPKIESITEYIIYIHTSDYRGYFKYSIGESATLKDLSEEDIPGKMILNLRHRELFWKSPPS